MTLRVDRVAAQGIDNALDRVGSLVTPPVVSKLSRECRVLCVGRDRPPRLRPHAYPSFAALASAAAAAAAAAARRASNAQAPPTTAVIPPDSVSGVLMVTVMRANHLADRDTFKVPVKGLRWCEMCVCVCVCVCVSE